MATLGKGFFVTSWLHYEIATRAYEKSKAKCSLHEALINGYTAVVFSACSLEGFVNEIAEASLLQPFINDPIARRLSNLVRETDDWKPSRWMKFMLAYIAITGDKYDRGKLPYQDMELLFELRNQVVHPKPRSRAEWNPAEITVTHPQNLIDRLSTRGVWRHPPKEQLMHPPLFDWTEGFVSPDLERWACTTAVNIIHDLAKGIPDGHLKTLVSGYIDKVFKPVL